jgi:hypothetical protein
MKTRTKTLVTCALAAFVVQAPALTFNDTTGETISVGILDISSVEVNSTATDLIFKINLTGDPIATDWGKYMIGFDTVAGGDTTGNGWTRPISMSSGMDYWVGSWADWGNGAEVWKYTGSWAVQSSTGGANPDNILFNKDTSSVTVQFSFAGLGLAPGSTFYFDVYTSGGGGTDGAIDALANPAQTIANWGDSYNTANPFQYTIPVPEPTSLALLGIGASILLGRYFRRR